jgi:serine/threonine protein phosphatase PrpC
VFERRDGLVVVVADGAGGFHGGALASDALVEAVKAAVVDERLVSLAEAQLIGVFKEADSKLAARMVGETTGVALILGEEGLVGVSAGERGVGCEQGSGR